VALVSLIISGARRYLNMKSKPGPERGVRAVIS
jgi:hypothetical protein